MKINHTNILNKINENEKDISAILLYGNEGGLISKLIKSIYKIIKEKLDVGEIIYFDQKNNKEEKINNILNKRSLFTKINFIVLRNPQETIAEELNNSIINNSIVIINGEGMTTKSKTKAYFDKHKSFISVPCYSLAKNDIKKIVDNFLSKHNITINKNAYWFLVENISEEYLILENELQKLFSLNNTSITIEDLRKILIQKSPANNDNYFFNCASGDYKSLLKDVNLSVKSIDDSYEIIGSIKRFILILTTIIINKDNFKIEDLINNNFPKYLFMKKELFKEVAKRINSKKINKIFKLIQKTEALLRKNSLQYKEITERFLLNTTKIIK